jgi:hypothetical protein
VAVAVVQELSTVTGVLVVVVLEVWLPRLVPLLAELRTQFQLVEEVLSQQMVVTLGLTMLVLQAVVVVEQATKELLLDVQVVHQEALLA